MAAPTPMRFVIAGKIDDKEFHQARVVARVRTARSLAAHGLHPSSSTLTPTLAPVTRDTLLYGR